MRSFKKQIEEAEEIAALNLAKFRQAQGHLADAEERADLNEQALAKAKTKGRAGSSVPMVSLQNNICIMFHWIKLPNFESIFFLHSKEQEIHHLIKTCSPMLQMAL